MYSQYKAYIVLFVVAKKSTGRRPSAAAGSAQQAAGPGHGGIANGVVGPLNGAAGPLNGVANGRKFYGLKRCSFQH